jgi:hypothetical protein
VCPEDQNVGHFVIGPVRAGDWPVIGRGVTETMPESVAGLLGERFAARLYAAIARQPYSHAVAAHDPQEDLLGVTIGTLANTRCFRDALGSDFVRLLLAACRAAGSSRRLWIARRVASRLLNRREDLRGEPGDPATENVLVWVTLRGSILGVTDALRAAVEDFYLEQGRTGPYVVRTVEANRAANRSILRSGGRLIRSVRLPEHVMNIYYRIPRGSRDGGG